VAAALLLLVPLLAAPWIAELETKRAVDGWREDPQAALSSLDRAESLNPLSTRPLLVRAAIELERSRLPAAEAAFREILEEEPDNAYALLQLGAIAGERGRSSEAVRLLERARALRPRDEITADVLAALRRGERVRVSAVNARIVERARARLQRQP
jgi:tetratricopeptide (TPR) repeat protein